MSLITHVELISEQSMHEELQEAAAQANAYVTHDLRNETANFLRMVNMNARDLSAHAEKLLNDTVFVATSMGARPYQEDRYGVCLIKDLPLGISPAHVGQLLFLAINEMGNHLQYESDGSTLTASLIHEGHIYTANVGDSRAIFMQALDNQQYDCIPLTVDHKPGYPPEKQRIESTGNRVVTHGVPRINGELAVSRALGDNNFRQKGLVHTPGISCFTIPSTTSHYLLLCTDGISDALSPLELTQFFATHKPSTRNNLADMLRSQSYQNGSTDNMTAVVVKICNQLPTLLCFVADGHGGDLASQAISEQLGQTLQHIINEFNLP